MLKHPLEDLEHQPVAQAGQAVDSPGGYKRSAGDLVDEEMSERQKIGEEQPVTPDDSMLDAGDDDATLKEVSDDGHSYAGTIVRGGLRGDSE